MSFGKLVELTLGWTYFDSRGTPVSTPTLPSRILPVDDNVTDFLDQCKVNERKHFEMMITLPLVKKSVTTEIFGLFWYIPFENDTEQRPNLPAPNDGTLSKSECLIRCYWQNRLVPESIVQKLPFFKEVDKRRVEGISPKWKERVVGVLFLDWQYDDISNNKLKLLHDLGDLIDTTPGVAFSPSCEPFIK
jgi:hypothetical protein